LGAAAGRGQGHGATLAHAAAITNFAGQRLTRQLVIDQRRATTGQGVERGGGPPRPTRRAPQQSCNLPPGKSHLAFGRGCAARPHAPLGPASAGSAGSADVRALQRPIRSATARLPLFQPRKDHSPHIPTDPVIHRALYTIVCGWRIIFRQSIWVGEYERFAYAPKSLARYVPAKSRRGRGPTANTSPSYYFLTTLVQLIRPLSITP
jgi:hypothetical protein